MSEAEDKAARLGHPVAGADSTGLNGIHRIQLTGSLQTFALPSAMPGKFVTMTVCSTDDVQFAFGVGSAPVLVKDQLAALGVGHVAAGKTIFSKTSLDRRVHRGATHLSVLSTGASGGYLEIECSEQLS